MTIFLDGKYINVSKKFVISLTPGHFSAQGVFETILVKDSKACFLKEHLERLAQGLKFYRIRHSWTNKQWQKVIGMIIRERGAKKLLRLRLMVWKDQGDIHTAVMALDYQLPSKKKYTHGVKMAFIKTNRVANSKMALVKSLNYDLFKKSLDKAVAQGFDDAFLINRRGEVFESTRANIFCYHDGQWLTPPLSSGCLNGIMRQHMIKLLKSQGIPIIEKKLHVKEIKKAEEIVLTNSLMGIISVQTYL